MYTQTMDDKIIKFIRRHHVLTLATTSTEGEIWCCNLFYAFDTTVEPTLIFTSQAHTRHTAEMLANRKVAGSIVLETRIVGRVQGLQFQGEVYQPQGEEHERIQRIYLKRFPYAALIGGELWALRLSKAKLTDNTLGFGTKLHWQQEQSDK